MAYKRKDQAKPEGLVFASKAISRQETLPRRYESPVSDNAGLLRCSRYVALTPPLCAAARQGCRNYGNRCPSFASTGSAAGWPAMFLSPAKSQEAGSDLHTQRWSCNVSRLQRSLVDRERRRRFSSCYSLRARDLSSSETDGFPQPQRQQQPPYRHTNIRCWKHRKGTSSFHLGEVLSRGDAVDCCLNGHADYINTYGRSLLRLLLEKGRRTLLGRRKRILAAKATTCLEPAEEATERSLRLLAAGATLIRRPTDPEGTYRIDGTAINEESLCHALGSPDSSLHNSSRTAENTTLEHTHDISHGKNGLATCSAFYCGPAQDTQFPPRGVQPAASTEACSKVTESCAPSHLDIGDKQRPPSGTASMEAFMEAVADCFQDVQHCVPRRDLQQQSPQKRLSHVTLFSSAEFPWHQSSFNEPCQPSACSSPSMANVDASATSAARKQVNAESGAEKEATKQDGAHQRIETTLSTSSTILVRRPSEDDYWRSVSCGDTKALFGCAVPETSSVCLENQSLRASEECLPSAAERLRKRTDYYHALQLMEHDAQISGINTGFCSRTWRHVLCLRCPHGPGEICNPHSAKTKLYRHKQRVGVVTACLSPLSPRVRCTLHASYHAAPPVATLHWKATTDDPKNLADRPLCRDKYEALSSKLHPRPSGAYNNTTVAESPLVATGPSEQQMTECDAPEKHHKRSGVLHAEVSKTVIPSPQANYQSKDSWNACESELHRFVHDTKAMKWISPERLLDSIAEALTALVERADPSPKTERNRKFDGIRCPSITVRDYFYRIATLCSCSCSCYLLALIYMDRLQDTVDNLFLDMLNIHRILITSIMCAAKFYDDKFLSNAYYATVSSEEVRAAVATCGKIQMVDTAPPASNNDMQASEPR